MAKISGSATGFRIGETTTDARETLGVRVFDSEGNEYIYVAASGVSKGAPVKIGGTPLALDKCVVGTDVYSLGVASQDFPDTGFTYGCVGVRGVHPTKVPSGTAANAPVQFASGTTEAASAASVNAQIGKTLVAAANDGSVIDVYWL